MCKRVLQYQFQNVIEFYLLHYTVNCFAMQSCAVYSICAMFISRTHGLSTHIKLFIENKNFLNEKIEQKKKKEEKN